jgi:phosphonate transport system ATP-binding protein
MQSLRSTNQSGGVTVVVSLHQVGYAVRYCDRVVAMKDGSVVCDCPAAQLSDERLRAVYGANYDAMTDEHAPPTHGDRPHEGPAAAVAEAKAGV